MLSVSEGVQEELEEGTRTSKRRIYFNWIAEIIQWDNNCHYSNALAVANQSFYDDWRVWGSMVGWNARKVLERGEVGEGNRRVCNFIF